MNNTAILRKTREVVLEYGPTSTEDLIECHFQNLSKKRLEELLDECWYVTSVPNNDSERWHLVNKATDREKLHYYPPDENPLGDHDEFFSDLADLIEEHETSPEDRYRYFCACIEFGEKWKVEPGSW